MIALRSLRTLLAVIGVAVLTMIQAVGASAAPDLIDAAPTAVAIDAPAPGEAHSWNMSVKNVAGQPVPLGLEITGHSNVLFTGPAPMELTVQTRDGVTVVNKVRVGDVLGRSMTLPELGAGASYDLIGTVTLPREADNSYQGASGNLKFRFVTSVDSPKVTPVSPVKGPDLASTGLGNVLPVAAAAAGLLALGFALILVRRKKSAHE
ncbi:LPXTG cell wall anchor domain-containing protein [Arthrobacter sp. M4]|uniref:LPXTG cell wall anchor domain-containing protein n=1 Tax=Arthrobacter sp. M4 TaxID=218160 RepID=UPI001CDC777F|nr:LPXTG cell wall anchor domain-containing protein [Arthrobacter sp. M4]MCA4134033.1 LPXTG cell wall anchor domain-containing protein [Arthrobacter sp. M4]